MQGPAGPNVPPRPVLDAAFGFGFGFGFDFGFELFAFNAALSLHDFVFDFCAIQMPF
jgi:hypothetical protein